MKICGVVQAFSMLVLRENAMILSAAHTYNREIFKNIMQLHASQGDVVADITYGQGNFWRSIPENLYNVVKSDVLTATHLKADFRALPYRSRRFKIAVFDPPYMHMSANSNYVKFGNFEHLYKNGETYHLRSASGHKGVLDLYITGARECYRILKRYGLLIVKCQDEVYSNINRFTHIEIVNSYKEIGFKLIDLFVLIRTALPVPGRPVKQKHARKNHSYFLIFRKMDQQSCRDSAVDIRH